MLKILMRLLHILFYLTIHQEYNGSSGVHIEGNKLLLNWVVAYAVHFDEFAVYISTIKNAPVNAVVEDQNRDIVKFFIVKL